jgi:hypothetical protein
MLSRGWYLPVPVDAPPLLSRSRRLCELECPDSTDPDANEYHTSFAIDLDGGDVYLFETEAEGLGLVHGVRWPRGLEGPTPAINHSISLVVDGDPDARFVVVDDPTPGRPNTTARLPHFLRGNVDDDASLTVTDPVATLQFLFFGGATPLCLDAADSNDSGGLNVSDAIWTLGFLCLGGPVPPPPGPFACGEDPTRDRLGCGAFPSCAR